MITKHGGLLPGKTTGRHESGCLHLVEFSFLAPDAKRVHIAGQFNDWNPHSMLMKKGRNGTWKIRMKLPAGKYEYKYLVDGLWVNESAKAATIPNPFGTNNCVINIP